MNYIDALILGIIQGITEWLPVSSSGHLVLGEQIFHLQSSVLFDTLLHTATLVAVVYFYRKDIMRMITAVMSWKTKSPDFLLFWYVGLATIPIVVFGLLFKEQIENAFSSSRVVGYSLITTGLILYTTKYSKPHAELNSNNSLIIGVAQVLALLPGISRSGTTISAGLHLGLKREEAARLSFLMFIPAVFGATILQTATADWSTIQTGPSIFGMIITFAVSLVALPWLIKIIKNGKLHHFAWYCWTIGLAVLVI